VSVLEESSASQMPTTVAGNVAGTTVRQSLNETLLMMLVKLAAVAVV